MNYLLVHDASYRSSSDWRYKALVNLPCFGDGTKFESFQEYKDFVLERKKEKELIKGELK